MCGICGSWRATGGDTSDRTIVAAMMAALEHRGPDGEGYWADQHVALGHRRLAIIDLAGGWQPLFNETRTVVVVFNGEIFNFRELRRELVLAGHRFSTSSDTEVIVHGYEQWGDAVVHRLRGMFAFALWDSPRERLLLARDRLGIKPLYYRQGSQGEGVTFASEIKALLADPATPRRLNEKRVAEYLLFRSVAGDETLFDEVRQLEPGTLLIASRNGVRTSRWWTPEPEEQPPPGPIDGIIADGRNRVREAVRTRMVSDVPLGTITSGGLDSSLVSAIAADLAPGSIDTFCAGFDETSFDERPYARAVSRYICSAHHERVATPQDIELELDRLTWAHDEPLSHPNSIPMHLLYRKAKEDVGVTVLLSGEGADEVFGGYDWYRVAWMRERLSGFGALSHLPRLFPFGPFRVAARVLAPEYFRFANAMSQPHTLEALLPGAATRLATIRQEYPTSADALFWHDQRSYLLPLLQRQDRMSMAAGIEARVPFLDHHLVEWANRLPTAIKLPKGETKGLLKTIARPWLPDRIIRRRKIGFAMPIGVWMRRGGPLAHRIAGLRERGSIVRDLVYRPELDRLIREHESGIDQTAILWTLLSLDAWSRVFLGNRIRAERLPGASTGRPPPSARHPTPIPRPSLRGIRVALHTVGPVPRAG